MNECNFDSLLSEIKDSGNCEVTIEQIENEKNM
jgi:hypothetical protein